MRCETTSTTAFSRSVFWTRRWGRATSSYGRASISQKRSPPTRTQEITRRTGSRAMSRARQDVRRVRPRVRRRHVWSAYIRSEEASTAGKGQARPATRRCGLETDLRDRRENAAVKNRSHRQAAQDHSGQPHRQGTPGGAQGGSRRRPLIFPTHIGRNFVEAMSDLGCAGFTDEQAEKLLASVDHVPCSQCLARMTMREDTQS